MKKNLVPFVVASLSLLVAVAALTFGCGKQAASAGQSPQFVSVEKTSFNDVTSQLDPGGNFYLYLST